MRFPVRPPFSSEISQPDPGSNSGSVFGIECQRWPWIPLVFRIPNIDTPRLHPVRRGPMFWIRKQCPPFQDSSKKRPASWCFVTYRLCFVFLHEKNTLKKDQRCDETCGSVKGLHSKFSGFPMDFLYRNLSDFSWDHQLGSTSARILTMPSLTRAWKPSNKLWVHGMPWTRNGPVRSTLLVVWNHGIWWLSIQLGRTSSQLTFTPSFLIFFRGVGWNHQPDCY